MDAQPVSNGGMDLGVAGFEWDKGNRDKCQKHGVPVATIESLFHGPLAVFPDLLHSGTEERFKAIGPTDDGRGVLVVFTLRRQEDDTFIRPVSARYMHRKEVEHYEKAIARAEKR
ncbi:MAG: BrnT family toxin [Acetobacteraceae bacterium]